MRIAEPTGPIGAPPAVRVYDASPLIAPIYRNRVENRDQERYEGALVETLQTVRLEESAPGDAAGQAARTSADGFLAHLRERYGRNGIDDAGAGAAIVVHMPYFFYQPWTGDAPDKNIHLAVSDAYAGVPVNLGGTVSKDAIAFTDDGSGGSKAYSRTTVAHELAHLVYSDEVADDTGMEDRERWAIREAWPDVMAAAYANLDAIDRGPWQRIADVPTDPAQLKQTGWRGSPAHAVASVLNVPAIEFGQKYGVGEMGEVWYRAITEHLPDLPRYADYGAAIRAAAVKRYGPAATQVSDLEAALRRVGVLG